MIRWYLPVLGLLLVLWAGVTVAYWSGAGGVGFRRTGTAVSFDREHDNALFQVADRIALTVRARSSDSYYGLVRIKRGVFPFCPLCGIYDLDGTLVNGVEYYKDGWFYRAPWEPPSGAPPQAYAFLYNLETGEHLSAREGTGTEEQARMLAERGLPLDDAFAVTPALVETISKPVRAINESCLVFNAAFILLVGLWLVVGIPVLIARRRR